MYKLMATNSFVTPLISVTLIIIGFNRQLLITGADKAVADCSHILKKTNIENVLNTTNKNTQINISNTKTNRLSNDLYKQYSDCVKTRYNSNRQVFQHRTKRLSNNLLEHRIKAINNRRPKSDHTSTNSDKMRRDQGMRFENVSQLIKKRMLIKMPILAKKKGDIILLNKQEHLHNEFMRLKRLMKFFHRFRKISYPPLKSMVRTSAEDMNGGSSSDILENEGMRFKKDLRRYNHK